MASEFDDTTLYAKAFKFFINIVNVGGFENLLATCFHAGFLLCLFFGPDDIGDMFLRNIG
jgi:hypothetical protein